MIIHPRYTREWDSAFDTVKVAQQGFDALPEDFADEDLDRCGKAFDSAFELFLDLPAPTLQHALDRFSFITETERHERDDVDVPALVAELVTLARAL